MSRTKRTTRGIRAAKGRDRLVCLTAYTAPVARLVDRHADLVLVGDSLGMVLYGFPSTIPVTLETMIAHGAAVARTCRRACVVVDLPFATYQESREQAFRNAARVVQATHCDAVKLEGGVEMAETIAFLVARGIPVFGHIGLLPQHVQASGYRKVADRDRVLRDAAAVAEAGAFATVIECVEPAIAAEATAAVAIPTIGIGAGPGCDGQIAVTEDLLGLTERPPPFAQPLVDLQAVADAALTDNRRRLETGED